MTFSQNVKNEIIRTVRNIRGCCAASFLLATFKAVGSLSINFKGFSFTVESDNYDFLTLCKNVAQSQFAVDGTVANCNVNAKGAEVYSCEFSGDIGEKLGLAERSADGAISINSDVSRMIPVKECCKRSFMQGLFLSCGSVVVPDLSRDGESRQKYHLELRFTDAEFALAVKERFAELDFHLTERKNYRVLYLKDSEKIADFLVYVNAMANRLQLEKIIIERSVRNDANRQSNCIAANIGKSVDASAWQLDAIASLRKQGKFDCLTDRLKEIALVREEFPEASLDEIAQRLGISKSGASHRFAKIRELSEK